MFPAEIAKNCVDEIIADLSNRSGLRQAWDNMDMDIQEEIKKEWTDIISDIIVMESGQ